MTIGPSMSWQPRSARTVSAGSCSIAESCHRQPPGACSSMPMRIHAAPSALDSTSTTCASDLRPTARHTPRHISLGLGGAEGHPQARGDTPPGVHVASAPAAQWDQVVTGHCGLNTQKRRLLRGLHRRLFLVLEWAREGRQPCADTTLRVQHVCTVCVVRVACATQDRGRRTGGHGTTSTHTPPPLSFGCTRTAASQPGAQQNVCWRAAIRDAHVWTRAGRTFAPVLVDGPASSE